MKEQLHRSEQQLTELSKCFLSFGPRAEENIERLVALCGEQLSGTCALYSRLEDGIFRPVAQWNTLSRSPAEAWSAGHICHGVLRSPDENIAVIRDLHLTEYAKNDPNISRFGLKTFISKAVSFSGEQIGSICVAFQDDRTLGDEDKKLMGIIASAIGVEEERTRAAKALRKSEATLRSITSSVRDAIIMIDDNGMISFWNEAAEQIFGWQASETIGNELHSFLIPDNHQEAYLLGMQHFAQNGTGAAIGKHIELMAKHKSGNEVPVELSLSAVKLKEQWHAVGIIRDMTERKRVEAKMEHMAYHDTLTGLPNRLLLDDRLNQAIAHAGRCGHLAAILLIDLDNFKAVNDTHGHTMGDRLLKTVAGRLMKLVRRCDTLARMGGDEFIIILTEVFEPEDAAHAARELLNSVAYPFVVDGHEFFITASIGISLYPLDGIRKETLLKNADIAMFQAKKHGWSSFQFFTEEINQRTEKRLMIETDLRHAIVHGEFTLHYQPWVDLAKGKIGGMEALIRWMHPQHGMILPDQFIEIAEETGLIVQIGEWVIKKSCGFLKELHGCGLGGLTMSVNVSGKQLRSEDLVELVGLVLADLDMEPGSLELELTESAVMENVEESSRYMDALKKTGVSLSLDDFGTGYSSLNYLKRFPLDRLKIDRSFVRDCPANPDDVAIARAVIALARSLNLLVTAEGVETLEQADFFSREGCDVIQGHFVGKPMSEDELRNVLIG